MASIRMVLMTKKLSDDLVSPRIFASLVSLNAKDGAPNLGRWCSGSTRDSKPLGEGSIPSRSAKSGPVAQRQSDRLIIGGLLVRVQSWATNQHA